VTEAFHEGKAVFYIQTISRTKNWNGALRMLIQSALYKKRPQSWIFM